MPLPPGGAGRRGTAHRPLRPRPLPARQGVRRHRPGRLAGCRREGRRTSSAQDVARVVARMAGPARGAAAEARRGALRSSWRAGWPRASSATRHSWRPSPAPSAATTRAFPRSGRWARFLFLRPLRRGQDRAGAGAGGRAVRRRRDAIDPPRHERAHRAAHGVARLVGAPAGLRRATAKAASSPRRAAPAHLGGAARRGGEGAPRGPQILLCRSSTRATSPTAAAAASSSPPRSWCSPPTSARTRSAAAPRDRWGSRSPAILRWRRRSRRSPAKTRWRGRRWSRRARPSRRSCGGGSTNASSSRRWPGTRWPGLRSCCSRKAPAVLWDERRIAFRGGPGLVDHLIAAGGHHAALGARPMRQVIQRLVESPLADEILAGRVRAGETLLACAGDAGVEFRRE